MLRNKKKRKVTSTTSSSPVPTTVASLPDEVVADILLRLPSAASICRAVLASEHWIRVASCPTFLRRLSDVHNYPLLLGHFVCPDVDGSMPPYFIPAPLHSSEPESDGVLAAMARRGDFLLTRILVRGSGRHVLEDCRGGLLLFSDMGTTLSVFNPMTHRVSCVEPLPAGRGGGAADHRARPLCLLPNGDDPDAFRVMSLQHGNGTKQARLEVYDSCTKAWRVVLVTANIPVRSKLAQIYRGHYSPAMHAGDRIFWKYADVSLLLLLDTKTMTFSDVPLPPGVHHGSAYAVGQTEDGTCCLVQVLERFDQKPRQMKVWHFKLGDAQEGNGNQIQMWKLEREVPLILNSTSPCLRVRQVRGIVGGIVLLCFNSSSSYKHHTAFRLKSLKVEAEFICCGLARPFVIE